ncbi:UNVERIFIED_CONTAM: hypothetical protein PYX00_009510 [Menopon gallinae]|uniref:snRNA-activating protein complex subunit 1 n=1 Tax=Menopon gallinae TaxID=328185 RepID=A0AAW2HBR8_9NEOP
MDECHEGYKLLKGVRLDVRTLLTNFEKTESVRFSDFCEEWKKMKFSFIFCARKTVVELLEFTEELLYIVKGYLEPPWSFHIRVGALYILYGLYFKQPIKEAVKIRFTLNEWKHLCDLIKQCKEAKHLDACFIHYKLYIQGAYVFTIISRPAGLERGFRKYGLKNKVSQNYLSEKIVDRSDIIEPQLLDSLIALETQYSKNKNEVLGRKNLKFVDEDFAVTVKGKLEKFQADVQKEYPVHGLKGKCEEDKKRDRSCSPVPEPETSVPGRSASPKTIFQKEFKATEKGFVREKNTRKKAKKEAQILCIDETDAGDSQSLELPDI